jgi:hypothetical protein
MLGVRPVHTAVRAAEFVLAADRWAAHCATQRTHIGRAGVRSVRAEGRCEVTEEERRLVGRARHLQALVDAGIDIRAAARDLVAETLSHWDKLPLWNQELVTTLRLALERFDGNQSAGAK